MKFTQLETERLLIKPVTEALAGNYCKTQQDPLMYTYRNTAPRNLENLKTHFKSMENGISPDNPDLDWLNWAIIEKEVPSVVIGMIEVAIFKGKQPLLGYWFGSPYWNKGYAYESCKRIIEHISSTSTFNSITVEMDTRNTSSIKLAEKLGFQYAKKIENADFFNGETSDEFVYILDLEKYK